MDESTDLQAALERAKESLKDVDDNIKKITGRDPSELRFGAFQGRRFPPVASGPNERNFNRFSAFGNGRRDTAGDNQPPQKRRALGSAYSRLGLRSDRRRSRDDESPDEDELPVKPTVQSSVVAYPKEQKSRKDCIEEQKPDAKGLARNRRMFGLLLGTLQKFRTEEHVKKDKEQKRIEIEKKLEENAEKEREELKRERRELYHERRKRQVQLKQLEYKIDLVKQVDEWEAHHKLLLNFIQTKTKPQICYLPAKHTDVSRLRLKESRKVIEEGIAERRSAIEEEIRLMGKRREAGGGGLGDGDENQEGGTREGMDVEEDMEGGEVEPDEFSTSQPDLPLVGDEAGQQQQQIEQYEVEANLDESKENFPVLSAVGPKQQQQEVTTVTAAAAPELEVAAVAASDEKSPAVPPPSSSSQPETEVETGDADATSNATDKRTFDGSTDRDMDAVDPIGLTEKEFEPIYD